MNQNLLDILACPRHQLPLSQTSNSLNCPSGCSFPVVDGVPVLLLEEATETMGIAGISLRRAREPGDDRFFVETLGLSDDQKRGILDLVAHPSQTVDPVVSYLVGATNGIAYVNLIGHLKEYPIPQIRLPESHGEILVDIGCSWGRWSIAAAKKGYRVIGIDPSLGAVMAAKRVARQLGIDKADYLVGDARFLPFADHTIDVAFSYSVIQHLSRDDAAAVVAQIGRVLKPGGRSLVQMPTKFGIRCVQHQARRRFREATGFEVRYWSLPSLRRLFSSRIGPTSFSVDCYFGIGLQYSDRHLMRPVLKAAVAVSEMLRKTSRAVPPLTWVADSVYVSSKK